MNTDDIEKVPIGISSDRDFVFDINQIPIAIANIESDIPEVRLISMHTLEMAVKFDFSFVTFDLLASISKSIYDQTTLSKSLELLGMISFVTDDFKQYFIQSDFFSIINSCFDLFDQKSRANLYLLLANVFHDESNLFIDNFNLIPLLLAVSEKENNPEYFRLIETIILRHNVSDQSFVSLLNILINPIKKQEQNASTVRYCLFGIRHSFVDHEAQVLYLLLGLNFINYLLPYLKTGIIKIVVESLELIYTMFLVSDNFYSMINVDFCHLIRDLMKFENQQIIAKSALVLSCYIANCGLNEEETKIFSDINEFNFVDIFSNGSFEVKTNILGLVQQILPFLPEDYPVNVFSQAFLSNICDLAFCEDLLARVSFYKFFGSLYMRYRDQEFAKKLDEVLNNTLVKEQIHDDSLSPDRCVSLNALMFLALLRGDLDFDVEL